MMGESRNGVSPNVLSISTPQIRRRPNVLKTWIPERRNEMDAWDWYIYLRGWLIFKVNVGTVKYAIHGWYGLWKAVFCWNELLGIFKNLTMCRIVQNKKIFCWKDSWLYMPKASFTTWELGLNHVKTNVNLRNRWIAGHESINRSTGKSCKKHWGSLGQFHKLTRPKTNMELQKSLVCRCFSFSKVGIFRFHLSFRECSIPKTNSSHPENASLNNFFLFPCAMVQLGAELLVDKVEAFGNVTLLTDFQLKIKL